MPRLSITIPDELMASLQPIKERINVSQVCREALERRILAFQAADKNEGDDLDMESLITRLREERALVEGKFEDLGMRNATAWLETTTYLDLKSIAENHNATNMGKYRLPHAAFQTMKKDMEEAKVSCEGTHTVAYKTAWLDYVGIVWAQVVNHVDDAKDSEPVEAIG